MNNTITNNKFYYGTFIIFDIISALIIILLFLGILSYVVFILFKEIYLKIKKFKHDYMSDKFNNGIEIISIDGNIGSGKSTLIEILKKYYQNNDNIIFLKEPVNEWQNITDVDNSNILDKFYKDKKRWSYTFQNFAFITRMTNLMKSYKETLQNIKKEKYLKKEQDKEKYNSNKNSNKNYYENYKKHKKKIKLPIKKIIITERSTETDKNIFVKMLYHKGYIDELEYNIYLYWYNNIISNYPKIKNIIYLDVDPKIAYERMLKRNRVEEDNVSKDYIDDVHKFHEQWLKENYKLNICNIKCSFDFEKDKDNKLKVIQNIDSFIMKLKNGH